ncbi:hypothetical protein TNCV_4107071 [Trichonephila clavipes]|nr:hypothetical protein TNCV_4107071 [Trichonephila clavipes]
MSSRWCGLVVSRGWCQLRCRPCHLTMVQNYVGDVGSLVVRASDSRPEGLGSMPDATKYPPSTHGFHAEIVEVEIGGVAIYHSFGEFRRAKSYCHLYGAQGQRQAYF